MENINKNGKYFNFIVWLNYGTIEFEKALAACG
jgi:hypothetical protein